MSEKAVEAAAKAIWELADNEVGWEASKADPKMLPQIEWTFEEARVAVAAYEAAMWSRIEDHDGSLDAVLVFFEKYANQRTLVGEAYFDGELSAWYWANTDSSDYLGGPISDVGRVTHYRHLPQAPAVKP